VDGGTGAKQPPPPAELPVYEVGGWLIEHQRVRLQGGAALETYQGLIADEIVMPQSAMDAADPAAAVDAAVRFADVMENQALFLPGEFAQEASWCFYVNDYLRQVNAGGHGQYFVNRGGDEIALRCCAFGLKSMIADPHLDLFNLFVRVQTSAPKAARRIAKEAGYNSPAAAIRDFDKRFAAIEAKEQLVPRQKTWLKSLRKLKVVPDAEVRDNLQRLASANRLLHARKNERDSRRAELEQSDPAYRVAAALCAAAGLRFIDLHASGFAPLRSVWTDGPDRTAYAFRVDTDRGARAALLYSDGGFSKRYRAVLLEDAGAPLTAQTLSRGAYDEIVPAAKT
jgi:hypothetical protein